MSLKAFKMNEAGLFRLDYSFVLFFLQKLVLYNVTEQIVMF